MSLAATAPAMAPRARAQAALGNAVWITWENQRRNHGIASALAVPLFVFDRKGSRIARYAASAWQSLRVIIARRPEIVFVQNPSIVLAFLAVTFVPWLGARVVVDAHNAAIIPLQRRSRTALAWIARYLARRAHLTIVTNESLARVIESAGGRAFVLPDRIPDIKPATDARRKSTGSIALFICTFAADEPFMEVIEAARSLDPSIQVLVTGNPRHRAAALKAIAPPNVTFTGFVPEEEYLELLRTADVVIDLTTREDCLVCGAYEAVAAGRPLVLSDTAVNREYFSQGVCYTDNTAASLVESITTATTKTEVLAADVRAMRTMLISDWEQRRTRLVTQLAPASHSREDRHIA